MQISMRKGFIALIFCLFTYVSNAQDFGIIEQDISDLVLDLTGLTQSYITPAVEGVAHQTTNGWFSKANIDDPWKINVSLQANLLFVPHKQRYFLIEENSLNNLIIVGEDTSALSPTGIGGDNTVELAGNIGDETFTFTTPDGINESNLWHAQLQVGLTLPHQSEVIIRFAPRINVGDAEYQSYGIGIHHSLSQWFKSLNESSWSFSTLIYYTKIDFATTFDEIDLILGNINLGEADSNAFGFNLIGSKRIDRFTLSGALNITASSYDYSIGGDNEELLQILNSALTNVDDNVSFATGNFSVRYDWDKFSTFTAVSFGQFQNLILGFNYRFDTN